MVTIFAFILGNPPRADKIGFELGLNWVCFDQVSNRVYFHKPSVNRYLHSFGCLGNWVCFA